MIIGTAGHIDHGKTSLVKALTGVDTDRLKEEKARGITIDLGYAYTPLPDGDVLGFVDVPGHEKLVHNMLAGATGIDFVLLVVAADDGPMPQTREHLAILDLLGLNRGAVALTKIDRVDAARVAAATEEIRSLLSGTGLARLPRFPAVRRDRAKACRHCAPISRQAAADASGASRQRPLPPGGGPLVHPCRHRHGRDRHGVLGRRAGGRQTAGVALRASKSACAASMPRTGPRKRPRRPALRAQSRRCAVRKGRCAPRRLGAGAPIHAPSSVSTRAASCSPPSRKRSSTGRRCICTSGASDVAGPGRAAGRRNASHRRHRPGPDRHRQAGMRCCTATASSCATSRRCAPWAAAGCSIRFRRRGTGAPRHVSRRCAPCRRPVTSGRCPRPGTIARWCGHHAFLPEPEYPARGSASVVANPADAGGHHAVRHHGLCAGALGSTAAVHRGAPGNGTPANARFSRAGSGAPAAHEHADSGPAGFCRAARRAVGRRAGRPKRPLAAPAGAQGGAYSR